MTHHQRGDWHHLVNLRSTMSSSEQAMSDWWGLRRGCCTARHSPVSVFPHRGRAQSGVSVLSKYILWLTLCPALAYISVWISVMSCLVNGCWDSLQYILLWTIKCHFTAYNRWVLLLPAITQNNRVHDKRQQTGFTGTPYRWKWTLAYSSHVHKYVNQ